jgi:hypothetical protein
VVHAGFGVNAPAVPPFGKIPHSLSHTRSARARRGHREKLYDYVNRNERRHEKRRSSDV